MDSENSPVLTSDNQEPLKSGVKTGYRTQDGHISQIPGLSPTIKTVPKEKAQGRRFAVLESDSDYVKLAKQGGHKGLLWHEEPISPNQKPYKPLHWFSSESNKVTNPSDDEKSPGDFSPPNAPFGNDNMSTWERSNDSIYGKEKNDGDNCSLTEEMQISSQNQTTNNFKRTVFDKKPAPVDMSKLLSFGYADGYKPPQ